MMKYTLLGLVILSLFNITAYANPEIIRTSPAQHKKEAGFAIGALLGGLIGGPPGAIIGAAGGTWFGNKENLADKKIVSLEKRLQEKQGELAYLQTRFSGLQSKYGQELQKVKSQKRLTALEELANGISLTIYFRTNSAEIDLDIIPRIEKLANFLSSFPEIRLQLEAHADRRGSSQFNKQLSQQRADAVEKALITAGIPEQQIRTYSYGETQALAAEGDREGYVFDRRVTIQLTLDSEA